MAERIRPTLADLDAMDTSEAMAWLAATPPLESVLIDNFIQGMLRR